MGQVPVEEGTALVHCREACERTLEEFLDGSRVNQRSSGLKPAQ